MLPLISEPTHDKGEVLARRTTNHHFLSYILVIIFNPMAENGMHSDVSQCAFCDHLKGKPNKTSYLCPSLLFCLLMI